MSIIDKQTDNKVRVADYYYYYLKRQLNGLDML